MKKSTDKRGFFYIRLLNSILTKMYKNVKLFDS